MKKLTVVSCFFSFSDSDESFVFTISFHDEFWENEITDNFCFRCKSLISFILSSTNFEKSQLTRLLLEIRGTTESTLKDSSGKFHLIIFLFPDLVPIIRCGKPYSRNFCVLKIFIFILDFVILKLQNRNQNHTLSSAISETVYKYIVRSTLENVMSTRNKTSTSCTSCRIICGSNYYAATVVLFSSARILCLYFGEVK